MTVTTYHLFGPSRALDAISPHLAHRRGSRAIAVLDDDQAPAFGAAMVLEQYPGQPSTLAWLDGPLAALQAQHEAGQPWDAKVQRRTLKAWQKGRDRIAAAEAELAEAKAALPELAKAVIRAHGNRPISLGETKLTPCFAACNDTVYLLESEEAHERPTARRARRRP